MQHATLTVPHRHLTGFTLVELLAVIGIITLLLAILVPVLASARRSAIRTTCAIQQREIVSALLARSTTNDGYLPLAGQVVLPATARSNDDLPSLLADGHRRRYAYSRATGIPFPTSALLAPFQIAVHRHLNAGNPSELVEPAELQAYRTSGADLFRCPAAEALDGLIGLPAEALQVGDTPYVNQHGLPLDYALNAGLMGFHHDPAFAHRRLRGQLARAGDASRLLVAGDADSTTPTSVTFAWSPPLSEEVSAATLGMLTSNAPDAPMDQPVLDARRHFGRINLAFADGHVESAEGDQDTLDNVLLLPSR